MRASHPVLIHEVVERTRQAASVSVNDLSKRADIARSTLDRKLHGASEFTVPELVRVAAVLGVTLRDLIELASAA